MQSNNSSPGTYRWRECGFVGEYQYVVTVRPLSMSSDQGTERWQLSPDQYQVDVVLYHAKHTHAGAHSAGQAVKQTPRHPNRQPGRHRDAQTLQTPITEPCLSRPDPLCVSLSLSARATQVRSTQAHSTPLL